MCSWFPELTELSETADHCHTWLCHTRDNEKISKSEKETHAHKIHHCVWDGVGEASVIRKLESVIRAIVCTKWRKWMSHEPNHPRKTT